MKTVRLWWIVAFQWQHMLETSRRFSDLFIPFYPTAVCSRERGKASCTKQGKTLCTFCWISVFSKLYRDLSNCQKKRKFQLHVLRWISRVFFPGWDRYEANRGAATLHGEAGSGAGADRFILASRETFPRSFRISVFFPVWGLQICWITSDWNTSNPSTLLCNLCSWRSCRVFIARFACWRAKKFKVHCLPFHSLVWVVTPLVRWPSLGVSTLSDNPAPTLLS